MAVQEGVDPETLLQGGRPPERLRFPGPLLPQEGENRVMRPAFHARRKQAEVSDSVPVAVGDVISQGG